MKNFRWWPVVGLVAFGAILNGCGGGSSAGDGQLRLINATLTHPSLDLIANAVNVISATAQDGVSGYVALGAGDPANTHRANL